MRRKMKFPLGRKIMLMMIIIAVVLTATCIIVSDIVFRDIMNDEYAMTADANAATVAVTVDGDKMEAFAQKVYDIYKASDKKVDNTKTNDPVFDEYSEQFLPLMETDEYIEMREELQKIQDVSEADCVYTLLPVPEDKTLIYLVDAAIEDDDLVTPGCYDLAEECCYKYLGDLSKGLPAFITNTVEYGWLITSCAPVYNSNGEVVCYAAVDLSMNEVYETERHFLYILAVLLLGITAVICIIFIIFVKYKIVRPINLLSEAAGQYRHKQVSDAHNEFGALKIHTGDELEILLGSMVQMEKDIDNYIDNLTKTKAQLSTARQHADDMHELAHMDSLTGIRNRLAYDKEMERLDNDIENGYLRFGIAMIDLNYLKYTNDTYGHKCGNAAIIKLSRMICDVFKHSPVFRIGGDEFAVILKNHDFDHIEHLVDEFESRIDSIADDTSIPPSDKVSAALGYAIFNSETDKSADDVFKRADTNMYERKKAMKAARGLPTNGR